MRIPFLINNSYRKKNLVLKALYNKWYDGEERSNFSVQVQPIGKSLSVLEINDITKLNRKEIERICSVLLNDKFVTITEDTNKNQKNHIWLITEDGISAYNNNHYLNELAKYERVTFFQVGAFCISVIALILSGINYHSQRKNAETPVDSYKSANSRIDSLLRK